jgi:hypothetical protein
LLVLIAATCTGLAGVITALTAGVVSVVNAVAEANARRSNVAIEHRLDAIETRVNGGFGLPLETEARHKKEVEFEAELTRIKARLTTCEAKP